MHSWSCQFILYSSHINGFLLLLDKNKKFYKGLIIWPWLTCLNTFLALNISAPATLMLFSPSAWEHLLSLKPQRLYTCHHLSPSCSYLFSPPTPFICLTSSFRRQFCLHSIGDSSISLNLCAFSHTPPSSIPPTQTFKRPVSLCQSMYQSSFTSLWDSVFPSTYKLHESWGYISFCSSHYS